jgi:uncharacterized protein (DUF1501 family)
MLQIKPKVLMPLISVFYRNTSLSTRFRAYGKSNLVTGMTFSEFGRRIKSNGSLGTDHGAGAPVIFFGAALNTGSSAITAQNPVSGMIGSPNIR